MWYVILMSMLVWFLLSLVFILLAVWRYSGCWGRFSIELVVGRC